jgi:hypothetical protein
MEICCAIHPKKKRNILECKLTGIAIMMYTQMVSGKISTLLARCNIQNIHQAVKVSEG